MFTLLSAILIIWGVAGWTDAVKRLGNLNWRNPQWEYRIGLFLFMIGFYFFRLILLIEWSYAFPLWSDVVLATATTGSALLAAYQWIQRRFHPGAPNGSGPLKTRADGTHTYDSV